ncbi:MAG: hypothetical protein AAFQ12_13460 [Pseudomonadota bacterium]
MFRTQPSVSSQASELNATFVPAELAVNEVHDADSFVTPEPTPKHESRRGWRRRRIKRGKS